MARRLVFAFLAALASCAVDTALAGTTGGLTGTIVDADGRPIDGARVSVAGPSQRESATSDAHGAFTFASLAPDVYVVSIEKGGFNSVVLQDVRVTADSNRTVSVVAQRLLRPIASTSTAGSGLVRSGTTRDVYSISPALAQAAEAIGAGANLQNAYSAIALVPGVYLPFGQQGAEQTLYIRGGNSSDVGYEYDGVPINRSFDNQPVSTLANLGQQELAVYTNGGDDGASASGIAGFVNQVIRTGTYPGFADVKAGIGSTSFYHGLTFEAGGATPDRRFSYYAGLSGYDQGYRYIDQYNGADQPIFGIGTASFATAVTGRGVIPDCTGALRTVDPFAGMPPAPGVSTGLGCWTTLTPSYGQVADISDREAVVNLHAAIPHRRDTGADELQVLYSTSAQAEHTYSSPDDAGAQFVSALLGGPATWPDGLTWPGGTTFGQAANGLSAVPFFDPSSPPHVFDAPLPLDHRDAQNFDDAIFKVQYQKNFGSSAYARLYLYSLYSDRDINGPIAYASGGVLLSYYNYDYELDSHTRGAALKTAFELGSKNFVEATLNAVTATTSRFNDQNYYNHASSLATNLTDGTTCYAYEDGSVSGVAYAAGQPAPCNSALTSGTFGDPTRGAVAPVGAASSAGATWRVTYAGNQGFLNTVQPVFDSASISDTYRPNARLTLSGALRFDEFGYRLANTGGPGRAFWFAAAQNEFCYNPKTGQPVLGAAVPPPLGFIETADPFIGIDCPVDATTGTPVQTVHPDGRDGHLLLSNVYASSESFGTIEPRIGMTYAAGPDTVLRLSYGRFAQGPFGASLQYDAAQSNLAKQIFLAFWPYGFTTPRHDAQATISDDVDFSYERRFRGTDASLKVTPYYRSASNQTYDVYSAFIGTALNTGFEQNAGVEFEFAKGDFKRNGLSLLLSYAYLASRERFANYPGTTQNPLDPYNLLIEEYDALTKVGGGAPCYANSGDSTPDPACGSTSIRNPYYTRAPRPALSRNAWYPTGLDYPYLSPHTFTTVANYRRNRFSVTPSLQVTAGPAYGNPGDVVGLDPRSCTNNSAGITGSAISKTDPLQADYTSCGPSPVNGGNLFIPNPYTGSFDRFGQFAQPWHASFNAALGYDVSPRAHISLTLANLYTGCFGGSKTPWSAMYPPSSSVCSYQANSFYVSNFYNGTSPNDLGANAVPLNSHFAQPFKPSFSDPNLANFNGPFNAYLQLSLRL